MGSAPPAGALRAQQLALGWADASCPCVVAPDRGAAGAVAERIARLHHEARDDAVEEDAVVVAVVGMGGEVFDRLGAPAQRPRRARGLDDGAH